MPISRFMNNSGGLNITDSPIIVQDNQATGNSYNYEYARTGAITKVLSHTKINDVADTQEKTIGLGMYHATTSDTRELVRAAGTKIQIVDLSNETFTDQESDTATPTTNFLDATSIQPVVFAGFSTVNGGAQLYMAGGGMDSIYGYTGSKITKNGTVAPIGSITATVSATGGSFQTTGTYYYAVQFRKTSTQAKSNVTLDKPAIIANTTDKVTINLTGISNIDTTLYDQIIVWRSAVGGVEGFTTGSIIAELPISATSYVDLGDSIADAQNTPRPGNLILDNSVLGSGTYNYVCVFKRRLVVAKNSTIYISDLNKPESWPAGNEITVPSGGPITSVMAVGIPSPNTTGVEEYLVIHKENEMWILTGSSIEDYSLQFIDKTGAAGQSLVVAFNGYLAWLGYTGIYLWDGSGKPTRISRPIQALFDSDGDLDKANLPQGYAAHFAKTNQIIFRISHKTKGVNCLSLKMDTRLTSLAMTKTLESAESDGIFIFDTNTTPYYALCSFRSSTKEELLVAGDTAGFVYTLYDSVSEDVAFTYETKPLDMGIPENNKLFKRVLVYVEKLAANDLTLNYWVDYRARDDYKSTVRVPLNPVRGTQPALWDIALWDLAVWNDYLPDIGIVEFNLHSYENNALGNSLKIQFQQIDANSPVRIHGFAVEWDDQGPISIPTGQLL